LRRFGGLIGVIAVLIVNIILDQFHPGFAKQTVAQTMQVWNFSGMILAGLAFALAGGYPVCVPCLAQEMVGKLLSEAPNPKKIGHYAWPTPATQVIEII